MFADITTKLLVYYSQMVLTHKSYHTDTFCATFPMSVLAVQMVIQQCFRTALFRDRKGGHYFPNNVELMREWIILTFRGRVTTWRA